MSTVSAEAHGSVPGPRASIVIPVFNKVELTLGCLESLAGSIDEAETPYEVVVIDNASTDRTPDLLRQLEGDVTVITNATNRGFGEACNQGFEVARAGLVVFLNNDTVLGPRWLEPLLGALDEDPFLGAVQPRLLYPDGRLNDAGGLVFADGEAWNYGKGHPEPDAPQFACRRAPDYVSGAVLAVRRAAFEGVGGFDPRYAPAYYEDTDLSFALRAAGWKVLYEPASSVIHLEGGTAGTDLGTGLKQYQLVNKEKFVEKWADELAWRPKLNPSIVEAWAHRGQGGFGPGEAGPDQDWGEVDSSAVAPGLWDLPGEQRWPAARMAAQRSRAVLFTDPVLVRPDRAAGSLRTYEMIRTLRAQGHTVVFGWNGHEPEDLEHTLPRLSRMGVAGYLLSIDVLAASAGPAVARQHGLAHLIERHRFDVALSGFWELTELLLPRLRDIAPDLPVVIDTHDVHYLRELREAAVNGSEEQRVEALRRRKRELEVIRCADVVMCVSEVDLAELRSRVKIRRGAIVPVTQPARPVGPGPRERSGCVFVGNFRHRPNIDAVKWWLTEIGPALQERAPHIGLSIVGYDPGGVVARLLDHVAPDVAARVEAVGFVPSLDPHLDRARVSVAPLRYGSGQKGKISAAMMAGVPVVTTTVGAEGLDLVEGRDAVVADDVGGIIDGIVALHDDEGQWISMRDNARIAAVERFGPARMWSSLEDFMSTVDERLGLRQGGITPR